MNDLVSVFLPFFILIALLVLKKIPVVGGNVKLAMIITGFVALLVSGNYSPVIWLKAFVHGANSLSWVMALIFFGGIFSEIQVQSGAMDTFLNVIRARFVRTPLSLMIVIMIFLLVAGSLFGDAGAAATIIGFLGIRALWELNLSGEKITSIIVMGSAMGSIMPPMTQATFMAASLMGIDPPTPVVNIVYFTVGLGAVILCFYASRWVSGDPLPAHMIPTEKASVILKHGGLSLIPLLCLVLIVLSQAAQHNIIAFLDPLFAPIASIPIISGLNFSTVKAILFCIAVCFFQPCVRKDWKKMFKEGASKLGSPIIMMLCASFLVGAFATGGQIATVQSLAVGLPSNLLKIGGVVIMLMMGMLTGSQATVQTTVFSVFGPALVAIGVTPVHAAVTGAHVAMAAQQCPPANLLTFFVAGLVSSITGKKVDPIKAMIISLPLSIYYVIVGLVFLYI